MITIDRKVVALTATTLLVNQGALASLLDFQGQYTSELEERAAVANQSVYDELRTQGCQDADRAPTTSCGGAVFSVWQNVREIVHNANELAGNDEPTEFSLGLSLEALGFVLRWTSAEEFSSQESLASSFVNGQLSGLASRISALRSGARGFSIAGHSLDQAKGLNAGDELIDGWSPWGGFLNSNYTYGDKAPTDLEDAFDFEGIEINGGIDYRINNHWVAGLVIGYQEEEIDFDSSQSIVDGQVDMDAYSIMPFVLYQSERWFYSLSLGYQHADFDTERRIQYGSNNVDVDATDTTAISTTEANIITANTATGYTFNLTPALTLEPTLSLNYQDVRIDEYTEQDLQNDGFNFIVDEQNFTSREVVLALKTQYVFSNRFGVFVPFANAEFYTQYDNDSRFINAIYAEAGNQITEASRFRLPTDGVDRDYKIYTIGLSVVLRGASQKEYGGQASGGIQAFVSFRQIKDIGDYEQKIISGGLRYEF